MKFLFVSLLLLVGTYASAHSQQTFDDAYLYCPKTHSHAIKTVLVLNGAAYPMRVSRQAAEDSVNSSLSMNEMQWRACKNVKHGRRSPLFDVKGSFEIVRGMTVFVVSAYEDAQ